MRRRVFLKLTWWMLYRPQVLMATANDLRTLVNETAACCADVEGGWDAWDSALAAAAEALDYKAVMATALQLENGVAELVGLKLVVKVAKGGAAKAGGVAAAPVRAASLSPSLRVQSASIEGRAAGRVVCGTGGARVRRQFRGKIDNMGLPALLQEGLWGSPLG